jgi:hypothetical protein
MNIYETKKFYEDRLFALKNVIGVGIGDKIVKGKPIQRRCIRVYVEKKLSLKKLSEKDIVPQELNCFQTDVIEIGKVEIFNEFRQKHRPALGGTSIGHYKITAGTFGCLVRDRETHKILILSNNHVLALSNRGKMGDEILQPGRYDGGEISSDTIGYLLKFIKIYRNSLLFRKTNIVDCAVAQPVAESFVSPKIMKIGLPKGIIHAKEKMKVQKTGRTTGHTEGKILDADVTIKINYRRFIAKFKHQIMTEAISRGGDSGSLVLNKDKYAVGLLFAGSSKVTLLNPIQDVLTSLNVELVTEDGL